MTFIHHTTDAHSYEAELPLSQENDLQNDAKSKLIPWQYTLNFSFTFSNVQAMQRHLQILTDNASPVSQGNPTLLDISSQTPAGDTLEEKSSESSEHKSTQVGSEKVLFCKCLLGRYLCFPKVGAPTLVKGKTCANGTIPLDR